MVNAFFDEKQGSKIEYVSLNTVPRVDSKNRWLELFNSIPPECAAMLCFNNRQRAHQVRGTIRSSAKYHKLNNIKTRVIRADKAIQGVEGWLVYYWKEDEHTTD